ncbi:hypothetical protein [Qipengyuania sp. NPDC077563]|uniref:hypothetical protein n=1 Tax=Qipengyuania sp. NPDC077563 TaxID=3364497 RepID=UPI00384D2B1C
MIFTRLNKASRPSSAVAMALVIAATGALGATALEAPAFAQKKKKEEKEQKGQYSKEFLAAYQPIDAVQKAETPDAAAAKAAVPALIAATSSPDEKRATGGALFNIGNKIGDEDMRIRGLELMMESGTLEPELAGQIGFAAYQAYSGRNDIPAARKALESAIAANYSTTATMSDGSQKTIGKPEMQRMIADLYFNADQTQEGLAYVSQTIDGLKAAGEPVPEQLIRVGLAQAYENNLQPQSRQYVAMLAENYPSPSVWGDAVIITLNSGGYANADALDLLRLSRRLNSYNDTRVLAEYIELLDSRRYPGEVVSAIDEGFALSNVDKSDPFLIESRKEAAGRVAADRQGLSALAADARKSGATLKTLVVAGDTFLSYDQPAEAEEFYSKALGMSGVETPVVLTRLGIAQFDQGKYAEANETFGKVEGARRDIANLWAIYAAQKGGM